MISSDSLKIKSLIMTINSNNIKIKSLRIHYVHTYLIHVIF